MRKFLAVLPSQSIPFVWRNRFAECLRYDSGRGRRHLGHGERDSRRRQPEQAALLELSPAESGSAL
jgi:hypothetical protein